MGFLTGNALQDVVLSETRRTLWLIAGAILVTGLARALFMMGRRLIAGRQALGIEFDMRNALYAKLLRLSFGFYDRHQTGQLMSRATVDLQAVRFFLGYGLIFFFQHVVTIVGVTAVMFVINWRLALAATAITPLHRHRRLQVLERLAPGPARRAAEDGRRRHGRRGEHRRRPRRQGLRPGRLGAGQVRAAVRGRVRPLGGGEPPARAVRARCCPSSRSSRRRPCCSSAAAWWRTARSRSASSSRSTSSS